MPTPPMKYQPYRGYGHDPWIYHLGVVRGGHRRIRTRSDWRWNLTPRPWGINDPRHPFRFWHRWSHNHGSVYEKRLAHRAFRRECKLAIARELAGDDDVSQHVRFCGDWLD